MTRSSKDEYSTGSIGRRHVMPKTLNINSVDEKKKHLNKEYIPISILKLCNLGQFIARFKLSWALFHRNEFGSAHTSSIRDHFFILQL